MESPSAVTPQRAPRLILVAVLLLSATGLLFELTLTRIFSATIWYHYAFVAISVALFGWGLGGFLVYALRLNRFENHATVILVVLSVAFSITLPLFLYAVLRFPFTPQRLNFYFGLSVLPFFAGGAALSLAFERYASDSNRLYFADLVGAAAGTLVIPLAIAWLGPETAVLAAAILPAIAAVLLSLSRASPGRRGGLALAAAVLLGAIVLTIWNHRAQFLTIRNAPDKALYRLLQAHPDAKVTSDCWNAYSRITAVTGFDDLHLARLFIDSDAETSVLPWDGTPQTPPDARGWFRAFPFRLVERPRVLVIGPGGGTDVVMAIAAGSPSVVAVEMNPLIVDAVRRFSAKAGNLYDHPNVQLVLDEGRNFIERTHERFDLIVLGFVDSWASVASGGLSLTENYLYTREALEAYYDHLSEGGALAVIRWPTDAPRLVANSVALLSERGLSIQEAGRQLLAVSKYRPLGAEPVETVFLLSRSPLSEPTVNRLLAGHPGAHVLYAPWRPSDALYVRLFSGEITFEQYAESFDTLATPVSDDRPFYFATDKPYGIPDFVMRLFRRPVLAVVGLAAVLLIAARALRYRAPGARTIAYFGALGVGFIVCEVSLLQRLILLLGHPIHTLVVLLFTLLLASGLGSLLARQVPTERIRRTLGFVLPAVMVLIASAAFALPSVVRAALPLSLPVRIVVAASLVFPFGLLMGMPFPLGLRKFTDGALAPPASALWGINGVASVAGSIAGVMLAVAAGFTWVFLGGAACYALAWATRPK